MRWHEDSFDLVEDLELGTTALCDLSGDPTCKADVAKDHADLVDRMTAAMHGFMGAPWTGVREGTASSAGVFLLDGKRVGHDLAITPGMRFQLWPRDAILAARENAVEHKVQALGGPLPADGDALHYDGEGDCGADVTLDADQKAALEAIGYLQK